MESWGQRTSSSTRFSAKKWRHWPQGGPRKKTLFTMYTMTKQRSCKQSSHWPRIGPRLEPPRRCWGRAGSEHRRSPAGAEYSKLYVFCEKPLLCVVFLAKLWASQKQNCYISPLKTKRFKLLFVFYSIKVTQLSLGFVPLCVEKSKCLCKFVKTFNFRTCFEIENKKSLKNCLVLRNVTYFAQDHVKWNLECFLKQKYQKYVGKAFLLALLKQLKSWKILILLTNFKYKKN